MSHSGPSAAEIVLSEDERAELVRRAGLPGRRRADRARIILACAEGMANAEAARELGVAVKSVSKWRRRVAAPRPRRRGGDAPPRPPEARAVPPPAAGAPPGPWGPGPQAPHYPA